MALSCEDVSRLVDENSPLSQTVLDHAQTCPRCREMLDRLTATEDELRAMGQEPVPPFLHGRVMAHVRSQHAGSVRRLWWAPALGAALAVAVVVWNSPVQAPDEVSSPLPSPSSLPEPPLVPTASPSHLGPVRGTEKPRPSEVLCVLTDSQGLTRPLRLNELQAPRAEAQWRIIVADTGEVLPETAEPTVALETLEILAGLDLAPGHYVLLRAERQTPPRGR